MSAIGEKRREIPDGFTMLRRTECHWKLSPAEIAALLQCDVLSFGSVTDVKELPKCSGVYFLIVDREIAYIGQIWRFDLRWRHHKKLRAELAKPNARIAILIIDGELGTIRALVERLFIKRFKPLLNKQSNGFNAKRPQKSTCHMGDVPFPG